MGILDTPGYSRSAADSRFAAKSAESAISAAAGLGTRGFAKKTRPVKKVLGYFGATGHGYTGAFGTVNLNDTSVPMLGTQSIAMALGSSASAAFQKDITAYDVTNKNIRLIFRITGNITGVIVYLSNDSALTNRASRNFVLSSALPTGVDHSVELPLSEFVPTGTFNPAAVTTVRVLGQSGPAGGTVSVGAVYATDDGYKSLPSGAVIFSADDTNIDHWLYLRPKLAQYGMAATLYPNIDAFVNPTASNFTLDQATYMRDIHGFDFGSHTLDVSHHVDHVGQTEAWLRDHFERIIAANKTYGFRGTSFAWPNTTSDALAQRIAGDYFKSARGGLSATEILPPGNVMNTRAYNMGSLTLAQMKSFVDVAKNGHGVAHFFLHALPVTKSGSNDTARQDFYDLVDYIAAQGVPTMTMSEFMDLPILA
jgi:hypothetical protein